MDLTLLYFDDCPNWKTTAEHLERLAEERPDLTLSQELVESPEEAQRVGFHGSPSIQVNGVDPFGDADAPVGLSCRVYQTPAGTAGSPTLEQLREALHGG